MVVFSSSMPSTLDGESRSARLQQVGAIAVKNAVTAPQQSAVTRGFRMAADRVAARGGEANVFGRPPSAVCGAADLERFRKIRAGGSRKRRTSKPCTPQTGPSHRGSATWTLANITPHWVTRPPPGCRSVLVSLADLPFSIRLRVSLRCGARPGARGNSIDCIRAAALDRKGRCTFEVLQTVCHQRRAFGNRRARARFGSEGRSFSVAGCADNRKAGRGPARVDSR